METCSLLSLKYSFSSTSSITTTFPSHGEMNMSSANSNVGLLGFLKKANNENIEPETDEQKEHPEGWKVGVY